MWEEVRRRVGWNLGREEESMRGKRIVATMYRAVVVVLKSVVRRVAMLSISVLFSASCPGVVDEGRRRSLGLTFAALKRITSGGPPRSLVMELRVRISEALSLTSQGWVETVVRGWAVVMVEAVVERLLWLREMRAMWLKEWVAKRRAVWRAMPGPEPTTRRVEAGILIERRG